MIRREELTEIGRFAKPHGINGEITFLPLYDEVDLTALRCIVTEPDGLPVPFFVEKTRRKGRESLLLTIDGIENETQAAELANKTVWAFTDDLDIEDEEPDFSEGFHASDLIGFTMKLHADGSEIGKIEDLDDSTENWLFIVRLPENERGKETVAVPVADEFITGVDPETRSVSVELPEGLLDL